VKNLVKLQAFSPLLPFSRSLALISPLVTSKAIKKSGERRVNSGGTSFQIVNNQKEKGLRPADLFDNARPFGMGQYYSPN
jgi:hypothetical protein